MPSKLITEFPEAVGFTTSMLLAVGDPDTGTLYKTTIEFLTIGPQGWQGSQGITGSQGFIGYQGPPGGDGPSYLNYVASLKQITYTQDHGTLAINHKYKIVSYNAGDDFTNIGATSNANDEEFVATGLTPFLTPTDWSNSSILLDMSISAPEAIIFESSMGYISYEYVNAGIYRIKSISGYFNPSTTFIVIGNSFNPSHYEPMVVNLEFIDNQTIEFKTSGVDSALPIDESLNHTSIEIRSYI